MTSLTPTKGHLSPLDCPPGFPLGVPPSPGSPLACEPLEGRFEGESSPPATAEACSWNPAPSSLLPPFLYFPWWTCITLIMQNPHTLNKPSLWFHKGSNSSSPDVLPTPPWAAPVPYWDLTAWRPLLQEEGQSGPGHPRLPLPSSRVPCRGQCLTPRAAAPAVEPEACKPWVFGCGQR